MIEFLKLVWNDYRTICPLFVPKYKKGFYKENNLSKLVDLIVPSAKQFQENKQKCLFITAKTTLRERWQEIPEEMSRTGINIAYLATLDEGISKNVETLLYEGNIVITTTKGIKEKGACLE